MSGNRASFGYVDGLCDFEIAHNQRGDMGVFDASKTRQEFAEECDINTIMDRYEKSGAITHVNQTTPIYMDVSSMPDLRSSLDIMREASLAFYSLPAKVRREFDNSPQFLFDSHFALYCARPMPLYGVPGNMDRL